MHEAASSGDLDLVQLLLDHGASSRARDAKNHSPAQIAQIRGYPDLSRALTSTDPQ